MPPSTALSEPALIAHIQRLPHARASFKQLIREFGARGACAMNWKRSSAAWPRAAT